MEYSIKQVFIAAVILVRNWNSRILGVFYLASDGSDISTCSISSYGSLETLTPRKVIFNSPTRKQEVKTIKKPSIENLRQKELERELKQVTHEITTLQRTLNGREEEVKKLEGCIQQLRKEKLALESNIATLRKEVASLKKSNDSLKQNVSEDIRKAVADAKRPMLDMLEKLKGDQVQKESCLQSTKTELEQNRTKLISLQQAYNELQQSVEQKISTAIESVREPLVAEQTKMKTHHKEQEQCLKSVLEHLEEKMKTTEECNQSLEKYRDSLVREIDSLKETILQMGVQKFDDDNFIRHLKGEVFAMKDAAVRKEEELEVANKKMADFENKITKLTEIKESQEKDLEKMKVRSCNLEESLETLEREAKKKEDLFERDLAELQQMCTDCQSDCDSLKANNNELSQCLKKQQELYECLEVKAKEQEENHRQMVLKMQNIEAQLSDAQLQNMQLENELQSLNWDKGCLEGELNGMQNQYQELTTDKIKLEAYYEDRLKDIQGQIVMMHDIVDNKQYEVNELLKVRAMLERNLQQLQNDLLFEKQTNRTREFLLQEQEKENWRELERTQKAEKDMRNELEDTIKNKSALSEELSGVKKQYECLKGSHEKLITELQHNLQEVSLNATQSCQKISEMEKTLQEKDRLLSEKEEKIQELGKLQVDKDENLQSSPGWKQKYEILYERILPFEKQLEAYEAEKQALLGISQNAQLEVEKLNRDYAKLFGHQNHKQKIHYVEKIKMENSSLKTELAKSREVIARQKRQLCKLECQIKSAECRKSSKSKENHAPLQEGTNNPS